jgi:hypothetical protein
MFGKQGSLLIEFGVSSLDGCAPEDSISVQISGQEGLLREAPGPSTELIWPATLEHPEGTYGLSGSFSSEEALAMARSMSPAPVASHSDIGC